MKYIKEGVPNFFTVLGLISGCISIVFAAFRGDLTIAGYFILLAAVFDFVDGMAARILKSQSEFGKQLDSLADVISFGVAPAMILYRLLLLSYVGSSPESDFDIMNPSFGEVVIIYSSFLVAAFSALRLARFNIDKQQVKNFRGLPTPANALLIASMGFISENGQFSLLQSIVFNRVFLLIFIVFSCTMLVSNMKMFSLKFSSLNLQENIIRYIFIVLTLVLLLLFKLPGISLVILLYILISIINNLFFRIV
jgi:CDP-diacylglycerol--serine O-phosphatidyltransferase